MTPTRPDPHAPHHHYSDAELHNQDVAHEEGDVNIRAVLTFAVGIAVVVALAAGLMGIMFRVLSNQAAARDPQVSPHALPSGQRPPEPNLLTNEPAGLRRFHEEEARSLEGYGWVDQSAGVARVPIEQAKKLLVERGLPVREGGAVQDPAAGTHAPAYGEASGGRAIPIPKAPAAAQQPAAPPTPAAPAATAETKK
jgi:hypothetical protein